MQTRKPLIKILLAIFGIFVTYFLLITLVYTFRFREPMVYYEVPAYFLDGSEMYARAGEKQFVRYSPFPFSLLKPKEFPNGLIVAYRHPNNRRHVRIARIRSKGEAGGWYIVTIPDVVKGEVETMIKHEWIIAKD